MQPDPLPRRDSRETLAQLEEWQRRLMKLVDEMERFYGVPGDNNQDVLDSSVHVAAYIASCQVAALRARISAPEVLA